MKTSYEDRNYGYGMRYSAGLTRRIEYLQQHANEMFLLDDFISRLRRDSLQMLNESAEKTNMECSRLMQQSEICFVQDMLFGYQQHLADVQTLYKTRLEDRDFLMELQQWRNRLIEQYAMLDISDWWSQLITNYDAWRIMVKRLYETRSLIDCDARTLVVLIGNLGFITSVLTGHTGEFVSRTDSARVDVAGEGNAVISNKPIGGNEEMFHFIHPSVSGGLERTIHEEVKRLVRTQRIPEICRYLSEMEDEKKILLPQMPSVTYAELIRMGMPSGEGFNIKTFMKYYKK